MFKVPCEFKDWNNINGVKIGYRVTIYYVICESERCIPFEIHTFTSQSDALDNAMLALECGVFSEMHRDYIYVSPTQYPVIYKMIEDYVSQTSSNKEC